MDWGNAIVRSKTIDASGKITAITMDLHLEGDFRKTKKKITWFSTSTSSHPLIETTLLDYDYLITKKKLEEDDKLEDLVTPVSEFREEAVADANIKGLQKGDIIQFERKGYYIFDGTSKDGRYEFIHIPDGRAASLVSKAGVPAAASTKQTAPAAAVWAGPIADTKMYNVDRVYGATEVSPIADTKMYPVDNVYDFVHG
jgi:glutamyl-tRNA synthetase